MRARISIGDVELRVDDPTITKADVTRWTKMCAMIAATLASVSTPTAEADVASAPLDAHVTLSAGDTPSIGFTPWGTGDPFGPDEE